MALRGTCNRWSRYFKEVDGISITTAAIKRRLEIEGVLGTAGIDERGKYHKYGFFYEVDVRRVCADLLTSTPMANENGFFEMNGVRYATCVIWSDYLKKEDIFIDSSTLFNRLRKMKKVGLDGRTCRKQFLKGAFYSEVDIREVIKCSFRTVTHVRKIVSASLSADAIQKQYLPILAQHGIVDRQSLLSRTTTWYNSEAQFDPIGKSFTFFSRILGRRVRRVTVAVLEEVADNLGWTEKNVVLSEEERQRYIDLLTPHGIADYGSLFDFGVPWFKLKSVQFPQIGDGFAFLSRVLGRPVRLISNEVLEEVAQWLKWDKSVDVGCVPLCSEDTVLNDLEEGQIESEEPLSDDEELSIDGAKKQSLQIFEASKQRYLQALAQKEITNYQSLFGYSIRWYNAKGLRFRPFGGSIKFFGLILGRTIARITIDVLQEVAGKFGWD